MRGDSSVDSLLVWSLTDFVIFFKDVMTWIIENHEAYQPNHLLKLVAYAYRGNEGEGASVEEALELVKGLYHDEK